jgi:hypothetical protein
MMPFGLVQGLDVNLRDFKEWRERLLITQRVEQESEEETEDGANELIDKLEVDCVEAFAGIVANLCITITYAVLAKLLDLLLGPLQWKHVALLYAIQISAALVSKQTITPIVMLSVLSIMPGAISGSLTRLLGTLYCIATILWPLVVHTWENISDRTEVRWVLFSLLIDLVYLGTAALISPVNDFGLNSLGLIVSVCVGECVISYLGAALLLSDGPWNGFFGRFSPFSEFLKCSTRFTAQLLLFFFNRLARYVFTAVFEPKPTYTAKNVHLLLARIQANIAGTGPSKDTAYIKDTNPYVYEKLQGEGSIRLLLIRKGWPSQKLDCKFNIIELGGSESYEAVSYVWGSPYATRSITVDGRTLRITKSAYEIIHRRRSAFLDQLIWIDQVCINQTDIQEKASQVEMMGQIYKEAVRVTAFLGDSENAHLVQLLFAQLHFMKQGLGLSSKVMTALSLLQRPMWNALVEFLSNPWFRRVWIVSNFQSVYSISVIWEFEKLLAPKLFVLPNAFHKALIISCFYSYIP